MRIIFMGTPDFAVPSLQRLVEAGYEIPAVVTAPDRPAGRGQKLRPSPVKAYAEARGLPILQPEKLRNPEFVAELEQIAPDLMVVVAFRMLPELVWRIPRIGTFNLHSSLLPDYRGAAPINWAVIRGEERTGVTTFFIDQQIDTGAILLQEETAIGPDETAGELHDRLMEMGADLVLRTVRELENGGLKAQPQADIAEPKHAPKIFRDDCRIEWSRPAGEVHNFIRGLSPYPGAWTEWDGQVLKVFRSQLAEREGFSAGEMKVVDGRIFVGTGEGTLELLELQVQGKRRMTAAEFLNGYKGEGGKLQ